MRFQQIDDRSGPLVSIIVPTLNEQATIAHMLADIALLPIAHEVIVADGGSTDRTRELATLAGATVIGAQRGRGRQLSTGARAARAPVLCFLHADVRLDSSARDALASAAVHGTGPATYRLRIDAPGLAYRIIERSTNWRSRVLRLPYGDQGLIVTREDYEAAGGFAELPLMEDVALVRALGRRGRVRVLDAELRVSARRWERDGRWRRTFRNWVLITAYLAGVSPARLARRYDA